MDRDADSSQQPHADRAISTLDDETATGASSPVESEEGPSVLPNLLRKSPPESLMPHNSTLSSAWTSPMPQAEVKQPRSSRAKELIRASSDEKTPLLANVASVTHLGGRRDLERQTSEAGEGCLRSFLDRGRAMMSKAGRTSMTAANPYRWNGKLIWQCAIVEPVCCLPAVAAGLLLNILDALSYGMILFPLGNPIFEHLGSAGISIYYVSTVISQVIFSGSIFKGAVGSELIEVVPFFHNMAQKITDIVGPENPDAVIATTIVSYALSSMMTNTVLYMMGKFKFGYLVGFIPRHILIGCIGGVGWFLVATGLEVSARLDGRLNYDIDTIKRLVRTDTVLLWLLPLIHAIILFYTQSRVQSKYLLPSYILAIPIIFYLLVVSIDALNTDLLREKGWIFRGPPPEEPWWYFYTLFHKTTFPLIILSLWRLTAGEELKLIRWDAVASVIPAMLALTFSILHVPINVPALALNCGEDNVDLDKELKLHGFSNFLSGCLGSIQNYLVYANTVFFLRSGGDKRLAGFLLALLTFGVMVIGPSIIGIIPVMMVGTLIFDLGFELLLEAIWLPRKKLKAAEYLTVIVIVLVMGIYDFVVGIGVGILLAFVSLIIQTSRVSAIRGTYDGDIVSSTVRRNPSQHHYLHQVGQQIYILKLTGYLFGTIVSVEAKIRAMLDDHTFARKPIKFLILDLWHVSGLDYSAGEAFNTISRLLDSKAVRFVISGVDAESQLGRSLRAVGLGNDDIEVLMLPNLNSAPESCENELLKTLYAKQEASSLQTSGPTANLDVPANPALAGLSAADTLFNSPRQNHLNEAAHAVMKHVEAQGPLKWKSFSEPLRLMLQIFQGLSDRNEDFWFRATPYFSRREYTAGTILFHRGKEADEFYLVEKGILRAEYDLPQGWLCESIVGGTTCGELPFFSETERTATVQVDRHCVVWLMDRRSWQQLQEEEPDVARDFLRVSLKLTSERMSAITSYILAMAD